MSARLKLYLCAALLGAPRAFASPAANGGTEANLSLGASSRGIALGGAVAASVDDASALYWNPGRLAALDRGTVMLSHAPIGFGDAAQSFAGIAYPALGIGTFGLGLLRLGTDGIDAYDVNSVAQGRIDYAETALLLGYARDVNVPGWGRLQFGATAKTLTQSLGPWSSTGAGLDLGAACELQRVPGLAVAAVLRDAMAPRVRLDHDADVAPAVLQLAGAWRVRAGQHTLFAIEGGLDHLRAVGWSTRFGAEATYRQRLQVRAGTSRQGMAFGLGVLWQRAGLDYAFLSRESAGTHPVSLQSAWGTSVQERFAARTAARDAALRAHLEVRVDQRVAGAQAAFDRGDWAAALDEWKVVAGLDPADERARRGMQAAGSKLAAEQARALAGREQSAARAAQFELGVKYYGENEYALAREVWGALAQDDPGNAEIERYLQKTNAALRAQLQAQADEARRLEAAGDWVDALAAWSRVHATDKADVDADAGLERCRTALERRQERRADPRAPAAPQATSGRTGAAPFRDAMSAYAGGDLPRAVALLREVRKLDPANREAARLLAKAERQMQPLGTEDRARVRDLYLRGMSFFTANQFDQAITEWSKILEIDPGNTSVYENIREARARVRALQP